MKKLLGILLLITLLAPFAGTYTWLHYHKYKVKKTIKHQIIKGLEEDQLTLLTFSKDETTSILHWKHSKEFEYKGEMYDIVKRDTIGGVIHFLCFWDNEETELVQNLNTFLSNSLNHDTQNKEKQNKLIDFLKNFYTSKKIELTIMDNAYTLGNKEEKKHPHRTPFPLSPPPDCFS